MKWPIFAKVHDEMMSPRTPSAGAFARAATAHAGSIPGEMRVTHAALHRGAVTAHALNPFPPPGHASEPSIGRRGTRAATAAAPVGPWYRPVAPLDRLSE